jgi:hypothetical protein
MMNQILELEVTDDIASIRSRIEFALSKLTPPMGGEATGASKRARLLLIVPRKNQALHSLVNMKLLGRLAKSRAVELGIVSTHPLVRDYARESGLKVFHNQYSARWAGWTTSQPPSAPSFGGLPPAVQAGTSAKRTRRVKKKKYVVVQGSGSGNIFMRIVRQLGVLMLTLLLALILVLSIFALLPQATVTLTPVARPVEANLVVKADPNLDAVNFQELSFPARVAQVELALSGEIETVETELAPVGQASGRVIFINRTEAEQFVPISTTLAASAGGLVEFQTVQSATIPAGIGSTSVPVPVIASQPGPDGNVSVGQVTRVVDPSISIVARVINEEPIGGGRFEPAKIVVQGDKERLDAYLRQLIQQEGLKQLQAISVGEQEFIPPESVEVIVLDIDYREFSGDFSDTFGGEMQAVVRATVVGGYNANRLALAALEAQVPPGYELDLEGLSFGAGEVLDINQDKVVTFKIFSKGQAVPVIDNHEVAQNITWLSVGEAQDLLSQQYQLATVPGIDLKPDWQAEWIGRLPFSSFRINVVVNDAVTFLADRRD